MGHTLFSATMCCVSYFTAEPQRWLEKELKRFALRKQTSIISHLHRSVLGKKSVASCEVTEGVRSSAEDWVSSS